MPRNASYNSSMLVVRKLSSRTAAPSTKTVKCDTAVL